MSTATTTLVHSVTTGRHDNTEKEVNEPDALDDVSEELGIEGSMMPWRERFEVALASNAGNRAINDDNVEAHLKQLMVDPDDEVKYTYRKGKLEDFYDKAPSIHVAIHYVPGADRAQVNMMENAELNKDARVEKSNEWKVLTAGNMLLELEVQRDLGIREFDQTAELIAKHKARHRGYTPSTAVADGIQKMSLTRPSEEDTVNISSKDVTIVNAFSKAPDVDLECTCIEIDGASLLNLIYNFRNLIKTQGQHANISSAETVRILEFMIEDARRLLVRSPILNRIAPRVLIQKSLNTRYGFDTGKMFHTFTTSKGIAEMIQQAVGYFSALQSPEEVKKIKPRFMQMVVFLLSLLNDKDLEKLRPSLEKSYNLQADRKSIELTILKVLTLHAVGPYSFLTGVLGAVRMERVEISKDTDENKSQYWDNFLGEIGRMGWLLPANGMQVGRDSGSWKMEWPKAAVNSDTFDQLQYAGEKDAVNSIPPLKLRNEARSSQEVSAEFQNGKMYKLTAQELEGITLAIKSRYVVLDTEQKTQCDLVVTEETLFQDLDGIWESVDRLCAKVNDYTAPISNASSQKRKLLSKIPKSSKSKGRQHFKVQKPQGRRTKHVTSVAPTTTKSEEIIAVSWKVDGRRITRNELLKGVNADITILTNCLAQLKAFADEHKSTSPDARGLIEDFHNVAQTVGRRLEKMDEARKSMQSSRFNNNDEPVTRVHFHEQVHWTQDMPWCRYIQGYSAETMLLGVEAERHVVSENPIWTGNVGTITLEDGQSITVTPLLDVTEMESPDVDDHQDEVAKGEALLLLGAVAAIVEPVDQEDSNRVKVVNFLKVTAINRGAVPKRRRRPAVAEKHRFEFK
jgi:hypothetical protein